MARSLDLDEPVDDCMLLDDERVLIAGKRGLTRLGLGLMSKFYSRLAWFPRDCGKLPDEATEFVARQLSVESGESGLYD